MSSSPRVVHGWVDVEVPPPDRGTRDEIQCAAAVLAGRGVRFVPVKLATDFASLVPLSTAEAAAFWRGMAPAGSSGQEDAGGLWFLAMARESTRPPFLKTLVKIAKAEGWRVASPESTGDIVLPAVPHNRAPSPLEWSEWAAKVIADMDAVERAATTKAPPPTLLERPLLSICVTTYNRAPWLAHSLPLILEQTAPYQDLVEVVVCDNASQDNTPAVAATFRDRPNFAFHRNEKNVGMLGNLGVSCDRARGKYVWVIGDDDLMVEGTVERVLSAIALHPSTELIYTNYAYTRFDRPDDLRDVAEVIRGARAISHHVRDEFAPRVSSIAAKSENCFTAIYCLIYRQDHARRAYHQDVSGRPFSSLLTSVPTAEYVCRQLLDRPGYWIGDPCVVINMNVSWLRYASLYILERFPELFDLMQEKGVDPGEMDALRARHVRNFPSWFREIYLGSHRENLPFFSVERLVRRFGHLAEFRALWPELEKVYRKAFANGRVEDPALTPDRLEAILAEKAERAPILL